MKKIILSALALLATMSISAQTVEVYEYNEDGSLSSTPVYTNSEKVKVVFRDSNSSETESSNAVEGTTTINGTIYTKAVGGTVADYVDLGITVNGKKVLWATHNLGASKPEEYGAYIAWGENGTEEEGYSAGVKTAGYNDWSNLKYCNGSYDSWTKYVATIYYGTVDNKTTLESEDDAATINWGGEWHTPTYAELKALKENCTWTWYASGNKDYNGVAGYKVSGNGNSIFLPAAGYRYDSSLSNAGSYGDYWSSSLHTTDSDYAYALSFISSDTFWSDDYRCNGRSVRPVRTSD